MAKQQEEKKTEKGKPQKEPEVQPLAPSTPSNRCCGQIQKFRKISPARGQPGRPAMPILSRGRSRASA